MAPSFHAQITEAVPLGTDGPPGAPPPAPRSSREGPEAGLASPGPGGRRPIRALFLPGILAPLPWQQQPPAGPPLQGFPPFPKNMAFSGGAREGGKGEQAARLPLVGGGCSRSPALGEQHWGLPPGTGVFRDSQNSLKRYLAFPLVPGHLAGKWRHEGCAFPPRGGCLATRFPSGRNSRHAEGGRLRHAARKNRENKIKRGSPSHSPPPLGSLVPVQALTFPAH